ncbi:hypothetical protein F5Y10DRAFT_214908 [Nemania abortiva]|nr:hypothetical protein F5Y10DRAFT_214908 [Nemania abortiva]
MEVIGAIASFIAVGQALAATPKIIRGFKPFKDADEQLNSLSEELERLYTLYEQLKTNIDLFTSHQNIPLLRVNEFPYLQLVQTSIESMIAELRGLADVYLITD